MLAPMPTMTDLIRNRREKLEEARSALKPPPPPLQPPLARCGKMNIDRFLEKKTRLFNGRCVMSEAVVAGGESWRIVFYPNGKFPGGTGDAVSVYLHLDDAGAVAKVIHVEFRFKLYEFGGGAPRFTSPKFVGNFGGRLVEELGFERFVTILDLDKAGILDDDRFTIGCEFSISSSPPEPSVEMPVPLPSASSPDPSVEMPAPPELARVPPPPVQTDPVLHADLGRLLETKEGADVNFEVRGKVFAAHKLVLAARSSVFKEDFFGSTKKKTTTSYVCDMDPKAFEALLHYIYTDTLPKMEKQAVLALDLLVAARRYDLKGLKSITENKLCNYVNVRTVWQLLAVAETHQCSKLKKMCLEFIPSIKDTKRIMATKDVERLARTCPSVVKDVLVEVLGARKETPRNPLISSRMEEKFVFCVFTCLFAYALFAIFCSVYMLIKACFF
ncbi:hypothetical protein EJB05_14488, partial [Eragrostis curvula]